MRHFALSATLAAGLSLISACHADHAALRGAGAARQEAPDPNRADDAARFLAGLPGRDASPFKLLEESPAWRQHARDMQALWGKFQVGRQPAMRRFAQSELHAGADRGRAVWYPFSGADALTMLTFFPGRRTYVMAALEPPGLVPGPERFSGEALAEELPAIAGTLQSLLQKSFFVTREMDSQLRGQVTDGVADPLLILLARSGYRIEGFEYIQLDDHGRVTPRIPGPKRSAFGLNRGIRFDIRPEQGGDTSALYYISLNLDDRHMKANHAFPAFLASLGATDTLLKATSYMLHSPQFGLVRSLILDRSASILQDDSGIPWRFFAGGPWQVQLYGDYVQPYGKSFQFRAQPDLRAVYEARKQQVRPLKFRIGYGAGRVTSNLQLARRRS